VLRAPRFAGFSYDRPVAPAFYLPVTISHLGPRDPRAFFCGSSRLDIPLCGVVASARAALARSADLVPLRPPRAEPRGSAARRAPFALDADRPNATERYGQCDTEGRITVRLVHARTGRPLRYSALIDTVIHELAHLRYMNHGPRWEALYHGMLEWARSEGIYEPRSSAAEPPASPPPSAPSGQLDLLK
jgi:hypothetical protein